MERIKYFTSSIYLKAGQTAEDFVIKEANEWLRKQRDKIVITHRQVIYCGTYPEVWIFYVQKH
ncbi:MAG: hypothetical protein A2271_03565 [Candidatus Moranbacteria bacterium RIFOXYA12_FULL_35_19]|nr:MAG: hypothetical protein UR78_C0026G0006 [Candidatus Moranbacteria bacterium GW2011_GWF2_35_39]OGI31867.1 MAG: hypothetical protein A2343_01505 [Candidatus Moranbacteria bacterium RIFOXYB12_FULL_35_8]OGI33389.1 MAG: hypothetical protein A2489_04050 [Candidatus Moranbacteria bacterium RIFOXYC12_FULL_36_13]OGI36261.1 MAG: hypothetical protein A2271_03565 [Candidatus Moranbacteria bacterium RIFOXYA12_FULL_35_19]